MGLRLVSRRLGLSADYLPTPSVSPAFRGRRRWRWRRRIALSPFPSFSTVISFFLSLPVVAQIYHPRLVELVNLRGWCLLAARWKLQLVSRIIRYWRRDEINFSCVTLLNYYLPEIALFAAKLIKICLSRLSWDRDTWFRRGFLGYLGIKFISKFIVTFIKSKWIFISFHNYRQSVSYINKQR